MKYTASALAIAGMAATVHGHGFITTPKARMPGSAFQAACGEQVYYNQMGDNYGNVQGELQVANTQSDYKAAECNVWLCKGFKYDDNKDNVQTYTAGQKVDIKFDVRAPHTGTANVSIVDTATNSVIGTPLISWDTYASTASSIPTNETSFSITIPDNLGSKCSTAGACVIQHFWDARSIDQTYESCVDFTVSGSGSGAASSTATAATKKAVVASTFKVNAVSSSTAVPSTFCTSTVTLTKSSSTAAQTGIDSAPTGVSADLTHSSAIVSSAVAALSTAIPSSILTATATGSANSTVKALPSGVTIKDCLDWINYIVDEKM